MPELVELVQLVERLQTAAPSAFGPLPVVFAYLYGSRAAAEPRPDSDIDIGVYLDDEVPESQREALAPRCADAISQAGELGGIEITVLNDAPLRFLGRVLRQRIVVFSQDEPFRVRYESLTGRTADDVEIWAAQMDAELLAAIAEGRR
jgi:predicted nucleotidyltransferase